MAKILFVVTEDWYFCSHRLPLAVATSQAGHEVVVATRVVDQGQVIEEAGIRVIPLKRMKRSSINPFSQLATLIELRSVFRRERPDLVHLVALKPVVYGGLVAKLVGVPARVSALGGLGFLFISDRLLARLLRPILLILFRVVLNDRRSRLIVQNRDDQELVTEKAGVDRSLVRLIRGSGVDLDRYAASDLPDGQPIVMLPSRMLWDKGVGEFVDAAKALGAQNVPARFVLVGDPDPENPASIPLAQLQRWHDAGFIEWWGHRADMPEVLAQASVVCLPSYREGLPKVLIEAMACGRPIVTTDVPGCRDLVETGKNGLLVKVKDAAEIAGALKSLVLDKPLCRQMGREGRRVVEGEFALARVIEETMDVYGELLGG